MDFKRINDAILDGNIASIPQLVKEALDQGITPEAILNQGLIAGMSIVGQKFKANEIFVPEVLIAAKAMHAGLDLLEPLLVKSGIKPKAKILLGTVKGDLHDIGKNLVGMMLKGAGFEVIDLGIDVPADKFVKKASEEEDVSIIAMSSLLTTSMPSMKDTIEALKMSGLNSKVKIVIGGAPVTQEYADEIGADGYAPDASSAVDRVKELLGI
ncbi:MAG: corrinoid protein [Candidatus Omnitrophica bacterium]|nr:corrinoid protein [Candidatus Omnitrophota bacterium]